MSAAALEAEIIKILANAPFPITVAQILNKYSTVVMEDTQIGGAKQLPKPNKKEINSILFRLKGEKLQSHGEFSPPSWSIIGKFPEYNKHQFM